MKVNGSSLTSSHLALLALVALPLEPVPAHAGTAWYVATTGNDGNDCLSPATPCASIDGAIGKASSDDTIFVAIGTYTGTGTEVVLVDKDLTLSGGWEDTFSMRNGVSTVDGEDARMGIAIGIGGITATVERFVARNGRAQFGPGAGGILNNGILTLNECTVEDNTNGGIGNLGSLTLNRSTVSGNSNNSGAGGINNYFMNNLTLNNSTVSGNTTTSEGGGINVAGSAMVSLNSSTVTGNSAAFGGGGIQNRSGGTLVFRNSIIAGNTAPFGPDCWSPDSGIFDSEGYNLIGNPVHCNFALGPGDLIYVDPKLGPLQDNGGPTRTHELEMDSPAIDAGNPGGCTDGDGHLLTTDQRRIRRPQGPVCDIGAFEFVPPGCPTSLALSNHAERRDIQRNLYRLRDEILDRSRTGRYFAWLFYHHADEIRSLMMRDPDLKTRTGDLLASLALKIAVVVDGGQAHLSRSELRQIQDLMDAYAARGSTRLRMTLWWLRYGMSYPSYLRSFGFRTAADRGSAENRAFR